MRWVIVFWAQQKPVNKLGRNSPISPQKRKGQRKSNIQIAIDGALACETSACLRYSQSRAKCPALVCSVTFSPSPIVVHAMLFYKAVALPFGAVEQHLHQCLPQFAFFHFADIFDDCVDVLIFIVLIFVFIPFIIRLSLFACNLLLINALCLIGKSGAINSKPVVAHKSPIQLTS